MKHLIRLILFSLIFPVNLFARNEIKVEQLKASPLIPLSMPLLIDSSDVNKKSFEIKDLLKTAVDFSDVKSSKTLIKADSEGVFSLDYAPYDSKVPGRDKAVQLLVFSLDADRYCKIKLSVTANDMFELYVDDKMEKSKETKEDSLSKASPVKLNITLEPRRYDLVIKRLASVKNFDEPKLKIVIEPEEKDSLAQVILSPDTQRRITINDIIEGDRLSATSTISPSGNYFLIGFTSTLPGGKSNSRLELRETETNKVLYRFPSDISPRWISEKDQLIVSRPGSKDKMKNLLLMDPISLEEKMIAENVQFDSYVLSPDLKFALFHIREEIPADKGDLKRLLHPSERPGAYRGRTSLYLYDFAAKTSSRITFGRSSTSASDISPDSKKALVKVYTDNITERPFSTNSYYELDLATLKIDSLFSDPHISRISYSPDGKYLLVSGNGDAFGGVGLNVEPGQIANLYDSQLFLYERQSGRVTPLTKDFDPNVSGAVWSRYDNRIYITAEDRDYVRVFSCDPKSGEIRKLDLPEEMIRRFSIADTSPRAIYQGEGTGNAYRLYRCDLKSGKSTLLADPYQHRLSEMALSPVQDWNFNTEDGTTIYGRYYLPYNFDPAKKYPLIVYYYGGTSPTPRVFESTYPLQVYAALGYVVYNLQPSGTTGFGQAFAARHVNAWGERSADEIIEGTLRFCKEHSFVDDKKIGCIGASYGGFMTQYLQTRTDIFAAAVSHAGISNIASYWGEGYWGYGYSAAASANSYPWNNPRLYTEQSPLFSADKINTPLLLLHGSVDTNVPIGESIQMYNALKILGKEVEFITVEGENHAIYGYEKRLKWNKTIYAWFARWLKDQPGWWEALYPER